MTPLGPLGLLIALTLLAPPPATAAPYAGVLKRAEAQFTVSGTDGASYRLVAVVDTPALGPDPVQFRLTVTRCQARRCAPPVDHVRWLRDDEFGDSVDLNVLRVGVPLGGLRLEFEWYSPPGFGADPRPTTDGGLALVTSAPANAVLLFGNTHGRVRCEDAAARAAVVAGVAVEGHLRPESWPAAEPGGLRVRRGAAVLPVCRSGR